MSTAGLLAVGHTLSPFFAVLDGSARRYVKAASVTPGGTVNGAAWSNNGTYFAVAHTITPRVRVYATSTWALETGTPTLGSTANAVDFSPNNVHLAVAYGTSPNLAVLSTTDWSTVTGTPTLPGIAYSCRFSTSGTLLAVGHANASGPRLTIINTSDWTVAQSLTTSNSVLGLSWTTDGALLAAVHNDGKRLTVFDTTDWSVVSTTPDLAAIGTPNACAFSPDGTTLAIAHGSGNRLTVLNVSDWTTVSGTVTLTDIGYSVDYSADNRLAVGFNVFPWVQVLDKLGQTVLWEPGYFAGSPRAVRWSRQPAAGTLSGTVLDSLEAPVQRQVLVVRDSTNDVVASGLSSATNGTFSLSVPTADGHTILMRETSGKVRVLGGGILPI